MYKIYTNALFIYIRLKMKTIYFDSNVFISNIYFLIVTYISYNYIRKMVHINKILRELVKISINFQIK